MLTDSIVSIYTIVGKREEVCFETKYCNCTECRPLYFEHDNRTDATRARARAGLIQWPEFVWPWQHPRTLARYISSAFGALAVFCFKTNIFSLTYYGIS